MSDPISIPTLRANLTLQIALIMRWQEVAALVEAAEAAHAYIYDGEPAGERLDRAFGRLDFGDTP